jgi:diguanylate cyclase (GGDEF)-like protein
MKKKIRATAARTAKRRKSGRAVGKAVLPRERRAKSPAPRSQPAVATDPAKPAIRRLRAQLARAQARINELEAAADIDFLLEIPNRRGFERELNRSIAYINRYRAGGALILLDVDRLKPINDAFGHAAGDQVLKAVVAALLRHVRTSDVIGRLGGDEFALLLWNLSETDAHAKAASLEQAVDQLSFVFRGRIVTAGASAGVAILGPHAQAGRALEQADRAMYVRKAQRRHET